MGKKLQPLSKRALKLYDHLAKGDFYPAYGDGVPKAMQELIAHRKVKIMGRVYKLGACWVPVKSRPLKMEKIVP